MTNLGAEAIQKSLHEALSKLASFSTCALLDYPDYPNVGDHLIWLGTIFYLTDVLKTKINYVASIKSFSADVMEQQIDQAPILLQGGGNLGDLWPEWQKFREKIVAQYPDRPIVILPQTIYFQDQSNLQQAANIFNAHPDLTLFVREDYSYQLACQYFTNCKIIKAPDMAFQLVGMPGLKANFQTKSSILYHCRQDQEFNQSFTTDFLQSFPKLVTQDWVPYQWIFRHSIPNQAGYWKIPGLVRLVREGWQRGLSNPLEWLSRQVWEQKHAYAAKFDQLYAPEMHRYSWSLMHSGVYQFQQHRLVITNRLHGHILCTLLEIPHLFLPNAYHKNAAFYKAWTHPIKFCRFIEKPQEIQQAAQELLELNFT